MTAHSHFMNQHSFRCASSAAAGTSAHLLAVLDIAILAVSIFAILVSLIIKIS